MARLPSGRQGSRVHLLAFLAALAWTAGAGARAEEAKDDAKADSRADRQELKRAIAEGDIGKVDDALAALAQSGGASGMKLVLGYLERTPGTEDGLYWSLIGGAVSFLDRAAMQELGSFVSRHKEQALARDVLYGLAKNASIHVVAAFRGLLKDGPADIRLLIAQRVSRVRSHEAVEALIDLLQSEERAKDGGPNELAWIAVEGLTAMTGQNFGPSSLNWEGWWDKNKRSPLPSTRDIEERARSTGTAVDFVRVDRERRQAFVGLEQAPPKTVVVLSAEYEKLKRNFDNDHIEKTLERMEIPHIVVRREGFLKHDLTGAGALIINCAQFRKQCVCPTCTPGAGQLNRLHPCTGCNKHVDFSAQLTRAQIEKIKAFVAEGGFLFCEDWVAKELVDKAYGKLLSVGAKLWTDPKSQPRKPNPGENPEKIVKLTLENGAVDVMPARGMGTHPYLRGVFVPKVISTPDPQAVAAGPAGEPEGEEEPDDVGKTVVVNPPRPEETPDHPEKPEPVTVKHTWTVDNESYALKVVDRARVVTILTSSVLAKATGGDGAVAVAFRPGAGPPPGHKGAGKGASGVVAVVLSHFGHQGSSEDEMSIQNLLLNFLIDANAAREARAPAKPSLRPPEKPAKKGGAKKAPEPKGDGAEKPADGKKGKP
ncbi:MAG: HEAT repeat domain-containing protein [Planctomycetes bacterium]|nr:HEAT repeat domain-containing protein [Planctomycetota bacterium]